MSRLSRQASRIERLDFSGHKKMEEAAETSSHIHHPLRAKSNVLVERRAGGIRRAV